MIILLYKYVYNATVNEYREETLTVGPQTKISLIILPTVF